MGEGDQGWHLMVAHGVFVSLWTFFLGLSGSDIGWAHFGEKESVSDLFQIVVVWGYGLGYKSLIYKWWSCLNSTFDPHGYTPWSTYSLCRPAFITYLFVFLCILLHMHTKLFMTNPGCREELFRWGSGKRICLPMQEMQEMRAPSPGWDDPMEQEMATCSSILQNSMHRGPGGPQSMVSQRVGHDWATENSV